MRYSNMSIIVYFILVVSNLISTTHTVDGRKTSISKAEEDDIEIQRQLRVLNKKPVKTITNQFGDIIDCIDIYKQPAFDNPLLKDHKIQMNPDSILGHATSKPISSSSIFRVLPKERCPSGSVPIRRTTRDDLVNANSFINKTKPIHANNAPFHVVAVEEVIEGKKYYGGSASISLHNLTVHPTEISTSQIWIMNGPTEEINAIEFGVMHNPSIFGDSNTRLFGYWTSHDGHQRTGCYNMLCSGFIQYSPTITFGAQFMSSIYGQVAYEIHLMVYLNPLSGWWLFMGPNEETSEPIGYWPSELFTHLNYSAAAVRYGGWVVGAESDRRSTPAMGNGHLPALCDFKKTAFIRRMKYLDEAGDRVDLLARAVQTRNSCARRECYDVLFDGRAVQSWGMTMFYGGPGGICS